jgi:siroheme synthase
VLVDARCGDAVLSGLREDGRGVRTEPGTAHGAVLVAGCKDGKAVVRLLPGDPFLHAEGAKEAEAVLKASQRLEVVPGLPDSVTIPAHAGLAVGLPQTVARVDDRTSFAALATAPGTLVLLVTVSGVAKAAAALVEHGRKAGERWLSPSAAPPPSSAPSRPRWRPSRASSAT